MLLEHNSFYVPTHLAIANNEKRVNEEIALLPAGKAVFLLSSIYHVIPGYTIFILRVYISLFLSHLSLRFFRSLFPLAILPIVHEVDEAFTP
jgi:hypothetical protein